MKYRDLIDFEPIDTVIQLRESKAEAEARRLVETYVVSDRMAAQIANVIIPQLQFDRPLDNKGVLIVGNYGTGKSHLMSLLAAVAEYPDLAAAVANAQVRAAAANIAGRFKVVRVEIGAVTSSLRDIVVRNLEEHLEDWGTPYTFPPADQLTNNKDALIAAVGALQASHPDTGILLVIDELLDYLRQRTEQALILDLGFLRELGEVARLTQFRFVGGLQETLFDSPRFAFVTDQLRRVRDRFEQVIIGRQDIAYVVANRILKKSDEQIARIDAHLRPFAPLYSAMAERMDEFARLFPIHPAYLDTFQNIVVAEKREVLKAVSSAVQGLLDQDVPADQPGLVSFDSYWGVLRDNPSMRTYPNVSDVLDKGKVLEDRLNGAFTRKPLLPVARRIVHALGVYRLTSEDIDAPIGLTPEELRDDLCLYAPIPERNADFLLSQVRVALNEIVKTVSGQYISHNDANDQYYLDLKKDIDFDARIDERGDAMSPDDLDRAFFDALTRVLNVTDAPYVTGHRLWAYQLPWQDHRVTRPGYLFFGAPDERNTAQPPRDFYLYLLPPFLDREWHDERRDDEVILALSELDDTFQTTLRRYAGARALERDSGGHRTVYAGKADELRRRLEMWLNTNLATRLTFSHQGVRRRLNDVLPRAVSSQSGSIEELVKLAAAALLAPHFADTYKDYPAFIRLTTLLTEESRENAAADAIRQIVGRGKTNLATAVLSGLGLLADDGTLRPTDSRYAGAILARLHGKPDGQVVNRGEVIVTVAGGVDRPVEKSPVDNLEPEWVAVVLVALAYAGEISVAVTAKSTLDASTVDAAATMAVDTIAHFQHYARPKQVPIQTWATVFERLGLNPALVKDEATRPQAIAALLAKLEDETRRVVGLQLIIANAPHIWGEPVFTDNFRLESEGGAVVGIVGDSSPVTTTRIKVGLREYKTILEELAKFNTPGKLRNLTLTQSEVKTRLAARDLADRAHRLDDLLRALQSITGYLAEAEASLPAEHPWSTRAEVAKRDVVDAVRQFARSGELPRPETDILADLEALKRDYIAVYAAAHRDAVLDAHGDERRVRLHDDPRLKAMDALSPIELLNSAELDAWKKAVANMRACRDFHEGMLDSRPTCPSCGYRPVQQRQSSANALLAHLDRRLDTLLTNWRQVLRENLQTEAARGSLAAMPNERAPVNAFLAQSDDDPAIPPAFAKAATTALRGLTALTLSVDDLVSALESGGLPCTVDQFKSRFDAFVQAAMRGKDSRGTRLTLDRPAAHLLAAAAD